MAGTTQYFGVTYPTSTDLVTNGATAIQAVADGFDAAVAIPTYNAQTGTTYTFVLLDAAKTVTASNSAASTYTIPPQASVVWTTGATLNLTNLGAGVVTIAAGAGVTVTNTAQKIAQFQSAQIIRTGSNAWTVTIGGGGQPPAFLPFASGAFYRTPAQSTIGATPVEDTTYYTHFYVGNTTTFDRIGCTTALTVTTAGTVRLGIYSDTNGAPSSLVLDAGTVAFSAVSTSYLITISQSLNAGWYWLAFNMQTGSAQFLGSGTTQDSGRGTQRMGGVTGTLQNMYLGYFTQTAVTGAFPATATPVTPTTSISYPNAYVRAL
jgi:hypothetical protein